MAGEVTLESFELGERVGRGGMGNVYRASHRETGVPVAVKVISRETDADMLRRFHREVQAHAGLHHPGIVHLFEYGVVDESDVDGPGNAVDASSPYIAMEYADRGTLRDRMPLTDWATLRSILVQMLDALAHAHARGVVHRDLKPENLLVFDELESDAARAPGDRVKLADFGIAHAFEDERSVEMQRLNSPVGTLAYMAPEQLRGEWRRYGPWTDLYALGCVAWELVCGERPFDGESRYAVALRHQEGPRPELDPEYPVPDGLEAWIRRAMAIEPDERFRRAADAAWALPAGDALRTTQPLTVPREPAADDELATRRPSVAISRRRSHTLTNSGILDETAGARPAPAETSEVGSPPDPGARDSETPGESPSRPPVPEGWQRDDSAPLPTPLVGTGLGLFGLREPPFVDRREARDAVWNRLREVVERRSRRTVFVTGHAGTGKSRLVEWMTTRAHEVGAARVLRATHARAGGGERGLRTALERTLRTVHLDRREVFEQLQTDLPPLEEWSDDRRIRDARALTEYLRPTGEDEQPEGPEFRFSNPEQRRALLHRTLQRLATDRPVILWLDDLQWGSEAIGLLEHLREASSTSTPLLVLATVRTEGTSVRTSSGARIAELAESERATRVDLEPLARSDQRDLLQGLLPLEDELADRLAGRTEGHPLFALQLLAHWIEGGDLAVGSEGFEVPADRDVELPGDIHQLWMDRIERLLEILPSDDRESAAESLELAAALGREVQEVEWSSVLAAAGIAPQNVLVDELIERGLAERTPEGWSFAHGLLVESLARSARDADRWRDHHRRCAEILEAQFSKVGIAPHERVAEHWVAAGRPERALEPLMDAVRQCWARGKEDERPRLLERRTELLDELDVPDDDPRRLEQRIDRAVEVAHDRDAREARELLRTYWEQAEGHPQLQAQAARRLAWAEQRLGNHDALKTWAERALDRSRQTGADNLECLAHRRLGWSYFFEADFERAAHHADRMVEAARRNRRRYHELMGLRLRATVWAEQGREGARDLLEEVARQARQEGYAAVEARAWNGLGERARFAGRLEDARSYYRRYLRIMRGLCRPLTEACVHLNLAQVELRSEEFERVREALRRTTEIRNRLGARQRFRDLEHVIRLVLAAGAGDSEEFSRLWERLDSGWPEEWRTINDHPRQLELAAEYAEDAGWTERAETLRELARDLWRRLGNEQAVERLQ